MPTGSRSTVSLLRAFMEWRLVGEQGPRSMGVVPRRDVDDKLRGLTTTLRSLADGNQFYEEPAPGTPTTYLL